MKTRPAIGARVQMLGNTGHKDIARRLATVVAHHSDGTAFFVKIDHTGQKLVCDPKNVELAETSHA